ncbi:MAG: hypothetical protein ABW137_06510 [Mycobacterium sp.]
MNRLSRLTMTALVSGALGLAGLGLGAGIAQAGGPYQWCPGDDPGGYGGGFNTPADGRPNWDWNVCHTFHYVNYGQGNVSPTVFEGIDPPPPAPWQPPNTCWALFIPHPC